MSFQDMGVEQDQYLVRVCGADLSHDKGRMVIQGTKGELVNEASQRDDEEKTMTTKGCSKGSKRDHKRSRDYKLDRESTEMKVQLEVMKEIIQRNVEDQGYGWILQKKREVEFVVE